MDRATAIRLNQCRGYWAMWASRVENRAPMYRRIREVAENYARHKGHRLIEQWTRDNLKNC